MMDLQAIFGKYTPKPLGVEKYYAVLIPVLYIGDERVILYESRAHDISQGGDTSFPGGRVEAGETFEEAAIRETVEEIGVPTEKIHILGQMDYIVSGGRFIAAYVAELAVTSLADLDINKDEVSYVFTLAIEQLMQQQTEKYVLTHQSQLPSDFPFERIPGGKQYPLQQSVKSEIPFYNVGEYLLWGMTAKLTERFISIIKESREKRDVNE